MQDKLNRLKCILAEVSDLNSAAAVLGWDQQVYMPKGGAQDRGHQLGTLQNLAHIKFTSDEVGKLLSDLKPYADQLDPDSIDACLIRVTRREYDKRVKVPSDLVIEFARTTTTAHHVWVEARANNDFSLFRPHLEHIVELRQRYAELFTPYEHVYDPLVDDFEPGLKTAEILTIFNTLRRQQVSLLQAIAASPQVENAFLYQRFDEKKQWDFGVEVITRFGYDWNRGRQDKSAHPFTQGFGIDDVRITTRFDPNYIGSALFSTMHEAGHALYEMGIDHAMARSPLSGGASLALHESQSRMWENLIGRSRPFWQYFYPCLQELFPSQLGSVDLESFYRGINRVEPSFIRVEADEATYNLHIMLRMELEIALMDGSLAVKDLPQAWNARMQDYLGIVPKNDAQGVLQDVHWSGGSIGYFSTYALGNLISVQIWERINQDIPDLTEQIRQGQFATLLGWLREHLHRHGAKYEPQDIVQRITGSKIDPAPYMRYLNQKFDEIYNL